MGWRVPALPRVDHESKVAYWYCLLEIPDEEPSSSILKSMAANRLIELKALTRAEAEQYLSASSN